VVAAAEAVESSVAARDVVVAVRVVVVGDAAVEAVEIAAMVFVVVDEVAVAVNLVPTSLTPALSQAWAHSLRHIVDYMHDPSGSALHWSIVAVSNQEHTTKRKEG